MMVISAWSRYFVELLSRLVCQLTISFHTFLGMTLHIVRSMKKYEDFPSMAVFQFTLRNSWFKHGSVTVQNIFAYFTLSLSASRFSWSRKDVGSPKSTSLLSTFHIGSLFCFFPAYLMSSTYTDKNNPFWRCTNKHSQLATFCQPYFNTTFSNCFSHNSPARGWPIQISFKRNDWVFHTGPWFLSLVSLQTNPNVWTLRFGNFQ